MLVGLHRKSLVTFYLSVLRPVIFVASSNMSSGADPNAINSNTAGGGGNSPGLPGAPNQGLPGDANQDTPQELTTASQGLTGTRQNLANPSQGFTPTQDLADSTASGSPMVDNVPLKKVEDNPLLSKNAILNPDLILEKSKVDPDNMHEKEKTGPPCYCPTNVAPNKKDTKNDEKLPSGSVEAGKYSVAYVTVPSMDVGKTIAHGLVKKGLAACVNIIPQVLSIYEWENKIEEDSEALLMIKTRTSEVDKLTAYVRSNHPYTVCEVISVPIMNGNYKYLKWIGDNVLGGKPASGNDNMACNTCCDDCV